MNYSRSIETLSLFSPIVLAAAFGCRERPPPPEPEPVIQASTQPASTSTTAVVSGNAATPGAGGNTATTNLPSGSVAGAPARKPASQYTVRDVTDSVERIRPGAAPGSPAEGDPLGGKFTLEDATKGLPKVGKLLAEILTDAGTLKCELYDDKAPNTVANFVGLARGIRPFNDPKTKTWGKRPAYDNGVFHRIIKGFMIQGGDPLGTGAGEGGYVIPDEVWPGAKHDRRGLICMANRGKNTNSMQFFVLDGAAAHLDGGYTIFGACGPDSVIEKLASSEVRGDRAVNPPKIKKVTIKRGK
jgi:peptidyl-prolyl cis-trans isomerase A (cyclophilin A)